MYRIVSHSRYYSPLNVNDLWRVLPFPTHKACALCRIVQSRHYSPFNIRAFVRFHLLPIPKVWSYILLPRYTYRGFSASDCGVEPRSRRIELRVTPRMPRTLSEDKYTLGRIECFTITLTYCLSAEVFTCITQPASLPLPTQWGDWTWPVSFVLEPHADSATATAPWKGAMLLLHQWGKSRRCRELNPNKKFNRLFFVTNNKLL